MSATSVVVGTADLRQALAAVRPHVATSKTFPEIARIRFTIGRNNMVVTATDRFTAGLAIVSTWDLEGEPGEIVELLEADIANLLKVFAVQGKDPGEDGPQYLLRFDIADDQVTITDSSGLGIVGRRLRIPRLETADALNAVTVLVNRAHFGQRTLLSELTDFTVSGDHMARFKEASKAYDATLAIETRRIRDDGRTSVLFRCGDSFLGLMLPRFVRPDDVSKAQESADGWSARLPEIALVGDNEAVADMFTAPVDEQPEAAVINTGELVGDREQLAQAAELVITTQFASPSALQRKMRIGFATARRVLEGLEALGVVGTKAGSRARAVLAKPEQLDEVLTAIRNSETVADATDSGAPQ